MRRVTVTDVAFDPLPPFVVEVHDVDEFVQVLRRVARVPTLNAGVAVNDRGVAEGDKTFSLRWTSADRAMLLSAERLLQHAFRVHVACVDGVFLAVPSAVRSISSTEKEFELLVLEKLT